MLPKKTKSMKLTGHIVIKEINTNVALTKSNALVHVAMGIQYIYNLYGTVSSKIGLVGL